MNERKDPQSFIDMLAAQNDFNTIKERRIIRAHHNCVCAHTGQVINGGDICLRREKNGGEVVVLHSGSHLFAWFCKQKGLSVDVVKGGLCPHGDITACKECCFL